MFRILAALLFLGVHVTFASEWTPGEWTQWRGPSRDGQVNTLPTSLEDLQLDWSVELEPSYSGPLCDTTRVYTTATVNKADEVVIAYDRKTGEELWRTSWAGAMKVPFFAAANGSWIRATPILSDGKLYVPGIRDVLVCLDVATGDEVWRKDFVADTNAGVPSFGNVTSPLMFDGILITQSGGAVVGLDAHTGEVVWTALESGGGMMSSGAFSSPTLVANAPGGPQLVVQTRSTLAGVNPVDGEVLWSTEVEAFRGMNILTPTVRVVGDDLEVFTSTYQVRSTMFAVAGGRGDVRTKWTATAKGYMASPVVVENRIILPLANQRTTALDWDTGDVLWTSKPYGKYWSMLTDGQNVLALDQTGELLRVDVSGEKINVLESRRVSDAETWAHVAWDGKQLFIRRLDGLDVYSAR